MKPIPCRRGLLQVATARSQLYKLKSRLRLLAAQAGKLGTPVIGTDAVAANGPTPAEEAESLRAKACTSGFHSCIIALYLTSTA